MNLPDRIALFPLGLVLYPDEPVPLHIFEPRYREMIAECLDSETPFGIVYAGEEVEGGLARVGCSARIRRVLQRYDDGRLDIVAIGEDRFRVVEVHRERAFLTADVRPFTARGAAEQPQPAERERMVTQHMKLLELAGEPVRPGLYDAARWLSFAVAPTSGLDAADKQRVLEMPNERERVAFLVAHFERTLKNAERARRLRHLAGGDGHAGSLPPSLRDPSGNDA